MIAKPAVFITSTGRTGTMFFGELFERAVRDCSSFHEPDCVTVNTPLQDFLAATRRFGPVQVVLGNLRPRGNMRGLSAGRMAGRFGRQQTARAVERLRERFVPGLKSRLYVESNLQLIGLIDILPQVFAKCRIVYLVRDGREWLRSCWSHSGGYFRATDLMQLLSGGRLRASMCAGDRWAEQWEQMDQFQKNCWLWAKKNRYALECVKRTNEARMWRFEDVFLGGRRYEVLEEVVDFATGFPDGTRFEHGSLDGMLERSVNASEPGPLPHWREWSGEQVRAFREICGSLMDELGYGEEPEWRRKCEAVSGS